MKTIKFRLTLDVEFDPQGESPTDLRRRMNLVVKNALNEGVLTGDSGATVERYDYTVLEIS